MLYRVYLKSEKCVFNVNVDSLKLFIELLNNLLHYRLSEMSERLIEKIKHCV